MKRNCLLSLYFLFGYLAYGQSLIAVQHDGTSTFEITIDSALSKAQSGDTIYLPGGIFKSNSNPITINKTIHLIGTGYYIDSAKVTRNTIFQNDVVFLNGSDNSSIDGLDMYGTQIFLGSNKSINSIQNISIQRCRVSTISVQGQASSSLIGNVKIINNVITSINTDSAKNCVISNNIILNYIRTNHSLVANNVFLDINYNVVFDSHYNTIKNNVFTGQLNLTFNSNYCEYNYLNNNIIYNIINKGNNIFYNNHEGISGDSSFKKPCSYSYLNQQRYSDECDFHLKQRSPGINGGADGTDIGIYGGINPWVYGGVPSNPHIFEKIIAPVTKPDGKLPVKIKVRAQDY